MVPASLNDRYVIRFCVCAQRATDGDINYAFDVIAQFADDLFEIIKIDAALKAAETKAQAAEEQKENIAEVNDDEAVDEVFMLDRKKKMSLRYKRSFFVRMVSDPKLYNPKIVRALSTSSCSNRRHTSDPAEPDSSVSMYNSPV